MNLEWEALRKKQNRRWSILKFVPQYKARFAMCVSWHDVMLTLLYWRVPRMVPENIKVSSYNH